jgi:hypothetical protein
MEKSLHPEMDGWMDREMLGFYSSGFGVAIADGRRKAEQTKLLLRVKTGTLRLPFIITTIFLIPIACANKITVLFGQTKR